MKKRKIGFFGNHVTMPVKQVKAFAALMNKVKHEYDEVEFHIGNTNGTDAEALQAVVEGKLATSIVFYPYKGREAPSYELTESILEGIPIVCSVNKNSTFEQNRALIDSCEALIAAPKENIERKDSETWKVINYCKLTKKTLFIVYPEGKVVRVGDK